MSAGTILRDSVVWLSALAFRARRFAKLDRVMCPLIRFAAGRDMDGASAVVFRNMKSVEDMLIVLSGMLRSLHIQAESSITRR